LLCPKCGKEVKTIVIKENVWHVVRFHGTRFSVHSDVEPEGMLFYHKDDDSPCELFPDEEWFYDLERFFLGIETELSGEVTRLF